MENKEIQELVEAFKGYRDLITPIEQNLREFSNSFESIKQDLSNLNESFDGNISSKLDKIYKDLSNQAEKSKSLTSQIDRFSNATNSYISGVDRLMSSLNQIQEKIKQVDSIQELADKQVERLNTIIDEKKKNYDIKQLQRSLDSYNTGVQKINEYINKDIAETLKSNNDKVMQIQDKTYSIFENIVSEKQDINKLIETYSQSNELLKKVVENNTVNQEYIYEMLDKWAEERNVKIKKKFHQLVV